MVIEMEYPYNFNITQSNIYKIDLTLKPEYTFWYIQKSKKQKTCFFISDTIDTIIDYFQYYKKYDIKNIDLWQKDIYVDENELNTVKKETKHQTYYQIYTINKNARRKNFSFYNINLIEAITFLKAKLNILDVITEIKTKPLDDYHFHSVC